MASARRLYRLNVALAGFGALAVVSALAVALSKLSLTPPPMDVVLAACARLLPEAPPPVGAIVLGLAGLALIVLARGLRAAFTEARVQVRVRSGLRSAVEHELDGGVVRLFHSSRPQAFCAGLVRPRVFLSASARDRLSEDELRAVLAHEGHHVLRRDPLRLLAARILAQALFFVPALHRLERRYADLAELAADEAAVRAAGSAALASALLKLGASDHPHATVALAPERVDHLCGAPTRWRLDTRTLVLSLVGVVGLAGVALLAGAMEGGVRVDVLSVVVQSCMALMLAVPLAAVGVAFWRRRHAPRGLGH